MFHGIAGKFIGKTYILELCPQNLPSFGKAEIDFCGDNFYLRQVSQQNLDYLSLRLSTFLWRHLVEEENSG